MNIGSLEERCCGCRTCRSVCPTGAITFAEDSAGFEIPAVNEELCVNCKKCLSVCPSLTEPQNDRHLRSGAAFVLDPETRKNASSGGLFGLFAQGVIKNGGVVYGAAFDGKLRLKTTAATSLSELEPLYRSKYFLCDTDGKCHQIRQDLEEGKTVLYCASPCQIAALKLFLKKEYEKLITVDFVCHGVGSQSLFDRSVQYIEKKRKLRITGYSFRYRKKNASTNHYFSYTYTKDNREGTKVGLYLFDPYYTAYQKRLACRDACHDCRYASEKRASDLTIADFHTIEKYDPSFNRFEGVSMFVCNTQKGLDFFSGFADSLRILDMDWQEVRKNNRFDNTEPSTPQREHFLKDLQLYSFDHVVKKYLRPSLSWKNIVYYQLPGPIRRLILKLIRK